MQDTPLLVTPEWLAERLGSPGLVVVDATVHLPDTGRDAVSEYRAEHIPGARFFDLSLIADPGNPLPRKVPPAEICAREVGALGIGNDAHIVAYDTPGLYSAARVWWLFRQYGHDRVSILNGGLVGWKAAGLPLEQGAGPVAPPASFAIRETRDLLALWPDVLRASESGAPILDARTAGRFSGAEPDRYPGTRDGHIPGARHLYWGDLLDPGTRRMLPPEVLRARFSAAGLGPEGPVTISCGSGLTACILALGLTITGREDWRVYDGSWDEWGRRPDLPIATGPD